VCHSHESHTCIHFRRGNLEIHSDHNLLDSLRAVLRRFEKDMGHDPKSVADLKGILRARIAELEAAASHHNSRMGKRAE
jgi:hypothetical protein